MERFRARVASSDLIGSSNILPASNVIPLNRRSGHMAQYDVVGPTIFTIETDPGPVDGAMLEVPVLANAANVPTYSGIFVAGTQAYDNTLNRINVLRFMHRDGASYVEILPTNRTGSPTPPPSTGGAFSSGFSAGFA